MAFEYRYDLSGRCDPVVVKWPAGPNQTITKGMLLSVSSGKAVAAAAGTTAVLGVAVSGKTTGGTVTDNDTVEVIIPTPTAVFEVNYTGNTKTSLNSSDLTTAFDLANANTIDLDDTVGGMCCVVGFDNVKKTADIVFKRSSLVFN